MILVALQGKKIRGESGNPFSLRFSHGILVDSRRLKFVTRYLKWRRIHRFLQHALARILARRTPQTSTPGIGLIRSLVQTIPPIHSSTMFNSGSTSSPAPPLPLALQSAKSTWILLSCENSKSLLRLPRNASELEPSVLLSAAALVTRRVFLMRRYIKRFIQR